MALYTAISISQTKNLRICGQPPGGSGEANSEITVNRKNAMIGADTGGNRSLRELTSAANATARAVCEAATETGTVAAATQDSQNPAFASVIWDLMSKRKLSMAK
jgi:hypothetical protein